MTSAIRTYRTDAASGVAETQNPTPEWGLAMVRVEPDSCSGTGTLTAKPYGAPAFETVYDNSGAALTTDFAGQQTWTLSGNYEAFKLTSDNSADTFALVVGGGGWR